MPEPAPDAALAQSLGKRLRLARLQQHKQQTVVAGLAGITTDYLYQIERGLKLPSLTVLIELARVLDRPLSVLLGEAPTNSRPNGITVTARSDAGAAAQPSYAFDAIPVPGSVPIGERLYAAMTNQPLASTGAPTDELKTGIARAWQLWQHSRQRYSQVGDLVPALVIEVEHQLRQLNSDDTAHQRRSIARQASDLYGLLRSFSKRVGRIELSLLSAERAIRTAELAEDLVRLAAARWNLAHVLLAAGQVDGADDVAMAATDTLRPWLNRGHATENAKSAALYGALLLVGSMAAVRRGDVWTARARVSEAERLAAKTGELNAYWTVFGPTNVAMHAASLELMAGQAVDGLHIGERIDHRTAGSIERRISFLLDQAQGWRQRRDNAQVLLLLLEAEREAPEDMRYRPAGQDLIQHLVTHGRRSVAEQAAQIAIRLGLPV
jgi:transcriptional regulator with XRE-family HTH domain